MKAPNILALPQIDRTTRDESKRSLKSYAEVIFILANMLNDRSCVFFDHDAALNALRFALPRERTVDLAQHILLRNDALRTNGSVWFRSRTQLAPLEGLWRPLVKSMVRSEQAARARGLLRMFRLIAAAFPALLCSTVSNCTANEY